MRDDRMRNMRVIGGNLLVLMGDMSHKDLAQRIGVHYNTIYRYMTGKSEVTATNLVRIARTLNCDVNDILKGVR